MFSVVLNFMLFYFLPSSIYSDKNNDICFFMLPLDNWSYLVVKGSPPTLPRNKVFFHNSFSAEKLSKGSTGNLSMAINQMHSNSIILGGTFPERGQQPLPHLSYMNCGIGICLMEQECNISQSNQDISRASRFGIKL